MSSSRADPETIYVGRFTFTRTRVGRYLETSRFWFRFYPGTWPRLDWHWKKR